MGPPSSKHVYRDHSGISRVVATLATIFCVALATAFLLLALGFAIYGFAAMVIAFYFGHGKVIAFLVVLGFIGSLLVATVLCTIPILLANRMRSQDMIRKWEMQQGSGKASS